MNHILVLLALWAIPGHARWLPLKESGSVIERFHVAHDVLKDGTYSQTVDYALRVQSEDAKVNASRFAIEYNSVTDQVDVLEAYTLNGKAKTPVDPAAIEDRDKGESKDYDVLKVRSVVFPQVQIGSRLFIRYRIRAVKSLVKDRWSTNIALYPGVHVESFKYEVKSELPLTWELKDPGHLLSLRAKGRTQIVATNKKIIPGWVYAEKDPFFHPDGHTELWVTTHASWPEFFSGLNHEYAQVLSVGTPAKLKSWVKAASRLKTPEEKILFLQERMSHEFRYFGDWRRHNGGLIPRGLVEIEKSRYGDCKDLSSLLSAMLRELGLDAHVALVRRGSNPWGVEPDYRLASVNRFNHAIVHVKAGGKTYWLDPTNTVASLTAYPDIAGRPALVLNAKEPYFERVPETSAADFPQEHEYEYRLNGDETVHVKLTARLKRLAPYQIANELMLMPRAQVLSDALEYFSEGQEVRSFKYLKEPATGRTLSDMEMKLEYEAGRVTFNAGKAAFLVIPDGFLNGAFYETEDRESDMQLSEEPFVFKGTRRLKDTRMMQDRPEPCRVDSEWMTIERRVDLDGRDVVITQQVELRRPVITRAEFRSPAFKKLQAETKRCFYRSGVLIEPIKGSLSSNAR